MRDDRPQTDTTHVLDGVYDGPGGVAARGRLLDADGELFAFVDVFATNGERIYKLRTYVD